MPHQHSITGTVSRPSLMRKHAAPPPPPATPERSRPRSVPSVPQRQQQQKQQGGRIPVVYYLCRNRHLEHPHFIEVPVSSSDGLYLRDVMNRLVALRGKAMPSMYSWSCKRSYKNGFVWHDLSDDDLIVPAQGNEYVLKGSELLDQSPPVRSTNNQAISQQETPVLSRTHEAAPPTQLQEAAISSPQRPLGHSAEASPEHSTRPETSSPGSVEYRVYKPQCGANASTQTDDMGRLPRAHQSPTTCIRGVSTDDGSSVDLESGQNEISRPETSSSTSTSGKTDTLESLIRAEARKMNSFRILEGHDEVLMPTASAKITATDMLIQLITCGSISVKDHRSYGLAPAYLPRFSRVRFPSPMFSGSMTRGELDYLSENPRIMGLSSEDKEYFSGSLIESKRHNDDLQEVVPTLKRSSSFDASRSCKSPDTKKEKEITVDSSRSKRVSPKVKVASNKQPRNEVRRSPLSDCQRTSSASLDCSLPTKGVSRRAIDASSDKGSSMRLESFKEDKGRVIKIEERLTSGARVIIQSRAPCEDSEGSSSS